MSLLELQNYLGKTLLEIKEPTKTEEEHKKRMADVQAISNISKVMVRNADVILRRDKAIGTGKLLDDATSRGL